MDSLRVLVLTNMFPTETLPAFGTFVADQVQSLRRLGVDLDVLFLNPRETRLNYLRGPTLLRRWIRTREYDLIHAHYLFCGMVAVTQRKLPVVLTHHGIEVLTSWTAPVSRWLSRLVDLTIVTSDEMARRLPVKSLVIPCGLDLDLFKPIPKTAARRELGLPQDKDLVLFVGEPRHEKRLDLVRHAVQTLSSSRNPVQLAVVSGQPHSRVPLWMSAGDVLVLASDHEGAPLVIKEAMACGLPIVSTRVGDVAKVIGDTPGCFLCRQDAADLPARLGDALAFGGRTGGRSRVQRFALENVAARVLAAYEGVLRRRA